jgi:cell division protease FtsH
LAKATDMAHDMVTRFGMDEALGYVTFEPPRAPLLELPAGLLPPQSRASPDTQTRIDAAIRSIVMAGFERATALLTVNRAVLESGARALLDKETLDEPALLALAADLQPL